MATLTPHSGHKVNGQPTKILTYLPNWIEQDVSILQNIQIESLKYLALVVVKS